ncbi:MAG: leucine-rich repeat protein [Candidatus Onthoplasma sp.]
MKNKNESVENNQQEEALKTPQKVSKKRKVIAVAATASVVLAAGVGVGVGVGIYNSLKPKQPALVKFVSDENKITKVYNDKGQLVNVSSLKVGDKVCFPSPKTTEIGSGDETEYFAGWATKSSATEPEYYVGEDFITITEKTQSFYPIYMKATSEVLAFEEVAESNSYTAKIDSSTLTDQKIVVIPNQYDGKVISSVIERTDSATANATIERIIIAKGVEEIGENAFTNLTALKNVTFTTDSYAYMVETDTGELASVTIPTSSEAELTTIAKNAFAGDTALEGISIPASVTYIGDTAFHNCSSLKYVNFTSDSELKTIANNTFNGCSSLAKFELPATVESIGNGTFVNCTSMKEFTVLLDSNGQSALKSIDGFAFYQSGIESMDLSKCSNLLSIAGKYDETTQSWTKSTKTFMGCANLKEVKLPSSVQFIGERAFINCPELTTVEIPEDSALACPIDCWFDSCSKLESIFIPKGITAIYSSSFNACSALTSVTFHDECTLSNQGTQHSVFKGSGITSITLPSGWTKIYYDTFRDCENLTSVVLSNKIETIGGYAFNGCSNLEEISIPKSLKTISSYAFSDCTNLAKLSFEQDSALETLDSYAFANCSSLTQIENMPENLKIISQFSFSGCTSLQNFTLPKNLETIDGQAFSECTSLIEIVIPASTKTIATKAFYNCTSLTKVEFEQGSQLSSVGERAFSCCTSLEKLGTFNDATKTLDDMIPNGVGIATGLFEYCSSLLSYRLPTSSETFTSVPEYMFNSCPSLNRLYYVDALENEIECLPSYIKTIGQYAFTGTGFEKVIIPSSVTDIGYRAFVSMKNLKEIKIESTTLSTGEDVFQSQSVVTITFGENVSSVTLGARAFQGCTITTINFESTVPPTIDLTQIASVDSLESIYVPADSVDAYKTAFADYAGKIVATSSSAE